MGLEFRGVAKEITSALNLGEDEGKIDALAGSLEDAANKSFGHSSELHTKLVSSLNQPSLLQSNRVKEFLDGERGGGTIITGELSPLQKEALERSMSPEQMESLGLARNILKNMMDAGAVQEPEPEDERPETPAKGVKFSFSKCTETFAGMTLAELMKDQLTKDECPVTGGVKNKLGDRIKKMTALEFHCYHNHIGYHHPDCCICNLTARSMKRTYVDKVIYHEVRVGYRFTMDAFVVSHRSNGAERG
eukprot:COSAG05_NODE_1486_length_4730_cov_147.028288_2_plen_248_part_00